MRTDAHRRWNRGALTGRPRRANVGQWRWAPVRSREVRIVAEEINRLFVGNMPFRMTQDELYDLFAQAGGVASVHIPTDRETGRPRGFGFVEMEEPIGKDQAIQMFNGYSVSGRALVVNEARPREPRAY